MNSKHNVLYKTWADESKNMTKEGRKEGRKKEEKLKQKCL
jgi:hypothetical protein